MFTLIEGNILTQLEKILPLNLFMDLERSGPIPLYFQVAQKIEAAIMDGELPAGSRLENEVALGDRLGLSRPTVRRAIQELVDKGLLVRRRGIGTQVVHGQVTRGVELTSLFEDLTRSGKKPSTKMLEIKEVKADSKMAEILAASPTAHLCACAPPFSLIPGPEQRHRGRKRGRRDHQRHVGHHERERRGIGVRLWWACHGVGGSARRPPDPPMVCTVAMRPLFTASWLAPNSRCCTARR